jgi:hypothetical protein
MDQELAVLRIRARTIARNWRDAIRSFIEPVMIAGGFAGSPNM